MCHLVYLMCSKHHRLSFEVQIHLCKYTAVHLTTYTASPVGGRLRRNPCFCSVFIGTIKSLHIPSPDLDDVPQAHLESCENNPLPIAPT